MCVLAEEKPVNLDTLVSRCRGPRAIGDFVEFALTRPDQAQLLATSREPLRSRDCARSIRTDDATHACVRRDRRRRTMRGSAEHHERVHGPPTPPHRPRLSTPPFPQRRAGRRGFNDDVASTHLVPSLSSTSTSSSSPSTSTVLGSHKRTIR